MWRHGRPVGPRSTTGSGASSGGGAGRGSSEGAGEWDTADGVGESDTAGSSDRSGCMCGVGDGWAAGVDATGSNPKEPIGVSSGSPAASLSAGGNGSVTSAAPLPRRGLVSLRFVIA